MNVAPKDTGNLEPTPWIKQQFLLDSEHIDVEKMAAAFGTHSVKKVQAILSSRDDWRTWYRVVKDHAKEKGVWEYFDPDADDETRPDLPRRPRVPAENEVFEGVYQHYLIAMHDWQAVSNRI